MSSFQIILLSIFGACAVAGILIFAFLVGSNSSSTIGAITIWGPFDEVAVQTIIRQLAEDDSRLRQITYVRKNPETFEVELTNALASGSGPDLYILRQDHAVVDEAKIEPIPYETFTRDQFETMFLEAAKPFLSANGVLAVPLVIDPYILYWNRDLLSAAGFAKPPVYWDETFGMARTITDCQRTNASKGSTIAGCDEQRSIKKATIAIGEYRNVEHAKGILGLLILQAGGPITLRDTSGALQPALTARRGEVAQPAESAINFYTTFANPSKDSYSWNRSFSSSRSSFAAGDVALYVGPASEIPLIKQLNPNLNYAVAPIPQIRNLEKSVNSGVVYGFAVPKASKNPGGALTAAYLLASPTAAKSLAAISGTVPARRDVVLEGRTGTDEMVGRQALLVQTWEDPNPEATGVIFRDMIESITSGSAKISEALQRAEQAMRQIQTP
jgi:ABC-type glycerol-3-phosphate transport system substrate-binding protein